MIVGLLRLAIVGFVVLTVVYVLVSIYSRSVRRERLEKRYDEGDVEGDRDAYIETGMRAYQKGLRRKLIWLVYIIPMGVMLGLVYFLNFS
jgi:hypothetical protein